jgi:ribokinase
MIYVLGSINTDLVIRTPRIPEQGETLIGSGFFTNHGGKGANQAVAAARSGADVTMVGMVGDDDFGHAAIQALKREGIVTDHIGTCDRPTGTAVILITDGDNRIVIDQGANMCLTPDMVKHALQDATSDDMLVVQFEIDPEIVSFGLSLAKEKGMTTLFNPAPFKPFSDELMGHVDILCANDPESDAITGIPGIRMPKISIRTMGADGLICHHDGTTVTIDAFSVKAVDTTGAGDTFIGAFAASLSRSEDIRSALVHASAASALCVTKEGAQQSIPKSDDINAFLKERAT